MGLKNGESVLFALHYTTLCSVRVADDAILMKRDSIFFASGVRELLLPITLHHVVLPRRPRGQANLPMKKTGCIAADMSEEEKSL